MPFAFHFAARSDVGLVRGNNEDSGYAGPHLLAMADGMGGHAGGEVASSVAIASLVQLDDEAHGAREAGDELLAAIAEANAQLGDRIKAERRLKGMGTTLIALLRARDKLVLAHIGDSRAFLARKGSVQQITKDHSYVQTLVDEGRISQEEAGTHPQRSLVTRVLTGGADDEPDLVVRQAQAGDRYLLASDGLTDYVARDTIDEILLGHDGDPGTAADRLVELALRAGAPDNVTVVIGDIVDLTQDDAPPSTPQAVGAVALRPKGTRPVPTTPAAKAAALTREATGTPSPDDEITLALAEEEATTRRGTIARVLGALVITAVVLAGAGYAAWSWLQSQYFVGVKSGQVTVFRGVNQSLGPMTFATAVQVTGIPVTDLPEVPYASTLKEGTVVASRDRADELVRELEVQARACRLARLEGDACEQVPSSWTPPTPTATPSGTGTGSGSPSPSSGATTSPGTLTASPNGSAGP